MALAQLSTVAFVICDL